MRVFVLPSWFPPHGGSFFQEQTKVLHQTLEQIVLYAHPISKKELLGRPFHFLLNLFRLYDTEVDGYRVVRMYYLRIPKLLRVNLYVQNKIYEWLYQYARSKYGSPDLIHCHSAMWAGWSALHLKKLTGTSYIITEHRGRFVDNNYVRRENLLLPVLFKRLGRIFSNASYICPVSKAMIPKISTYCQGEQTIQEIPNLANEDLFQYRDNKKFESFTFITVAALEPHKGIDTLLRAFADAKSHVKDTQLFVVGDGSQRKNLMQLARDLGIEKSVKFLGAQCREKVAEFMSFSHIFVLPTKYEAFGVVYLEALFSGLPVIGTKGSGGPESIIEHGVNGYLVSIDDVDGLSGSMIEACQNYDTFDRKKIAYDAIERYGHAAFRSKYLQIYKQVLNKKNTRSFLSGVSGDD